MTAPAADAKEFTLRAPGPDHSHTKYFVGKFSGSQPDFSAAKSGRWSLTREPAEDQSAEPDLARTQPWLLQDASGTVTHRGHLEGGLGQANSSAGYFILIKEGNAFTALPAEQFYTFRPKQRFKVKTLEEAELQMNGGQQARQPMAHSRLAALVANVDEEDANANNMEAEASGSDAEAAEQDDIEQHAPGGRRAGPHASSAAANGHRHDGEDNADPDGANNRDGKREDWEHEEERQDDDVDMEGEDAEDGEPSPSPPRPVSGEGEAGQRSMTTPEKTLQRMLNTTGLTSESDAEGGSKEEEEDDDEDDEPDLDALATRLSAKASKGRSRSRSATPSGSDAPKRLAASNKRKADAQPAAASKKAKPSVPAAAAPAPTGEVTEAEIIEFMRGLGPMPSNQLTSHFRRRVVSMEQRKAFTAKVKKLAKLQEVEPGKKYIVLR